MYNPAINNLSKSVTFTYKNVSTNFYNYYYIFSIFGKIGIFVKILQLNHIAFQFYSYQIIKSYCVNLFSLDQISNLIKMQILCLHFAYKDLKILCSTFYFKAS